MTFSFVSHAKGSGGSAKSQYSASGDSKSCDISIKYGGTIYKLNDRVMQIKNNYDKNVFNGDMG